MINLIRFLYFIADFDINPVAQDIQEGLERDRIAEAAIGWKMILFPTPAIKRMLIVGVGIAVAQQAVGIDAIQYYLLDILAESGIQSQKEQLGVLILLGVLKLIFVIIGSKLMDTRGRKKMMFISLIGAFRCSAFFTSNRVFVVLLLQFESSCDY